MTSNRDDVLARLSDSNVGYIFQFLEDAELYDLSMTSVRMHKLALSLLLSRCNIPDPLEWVDIHIGDRKTLQILRVARFIPSIRQLSIRFSPGTSPWIIPPYPALTLGQLQSTAKGLVLEMGHLKRLLSKLHSVGEITLILPGSLEWNLRDVNLERGSTSDIFSWSPILSCFQEILGKKCTSFKVEASPFWTQAHVAPHPGKASGGSMSHLLRKLLRRKNVPDMSALARWDGAKYRPQKSPHAATIRSGTRITTFSIKNTLLFFPPCAGWTFSVLKHSPLVALHISGLNISQWDWDQIAWKIAASVPNLLELNFDDREISPDCLMLLLNRLPRLTSLTIGQSMAVALAHPRLFAPFGDWYLPAFRSLTKLSAHASYLSLFLLRRNPLPALISLPLPPISIYEITTFHHKSFYVLIPGILHHLRDVNHHLFPLPVTISLGYGGQDNSHWFSRHIDTSLALDPKILASLREITDLVLTDFNSLIDVSCLARWLTLFPTLRRVAWQDTDSQRATRVNIAHLAREISRACPTVETITAQGVLYSISSLLTPPKILGQSTGVLKLCDLPTEVLLLISDFLHNELFYLSLLCRRLHFLALPIFLARNLIENPCEVTTLDMGAIEDSELVLRALTVSLFVPSIKHLVCLFPDPPYIYQHLDRILGVARLVKRLDNLEHLSLNFASNHYRLGSLRQGYDEHHIRESCYCALNGLLSAISDKSCTSLTIVGCPAMGTAYAATIAQPPASITSISNLCLDVDRRPIYSWWLFKALEKSPITSLNLTVTDIASLEDIRGFATALTVLSIDSAIVYRHWSMEVVDFLARCPHIRTLALGPNLAKPPYPTNVPVKKTNLHLDSLVDLTAHVSYVHYFFHALDRLPVLERLRIILEGPDSVDWAFTSLIEGVREYYSSPPSITLEIVDPLDMASLARSIDSISFLGGKWMHAARHITRVAVQCHLEWFRPAETGLLINPDVFPLLVNWFSLFKGSRSISIHGLDKVSSDSLVGLAESIGHALPSVQVIQWNEQTLYQRSYRFVSCVSTSSSD
ncbi:hypothetical protein FB451DRAFT_1397778 [Mycena latifolia]|nr:hypothetical protein FB451DRAFT_1397778 [Mycena latifolia]